LVALSHVTEKNNRIEPTVQITESTLKGLVLNLVLKKALLLGAFFYGSYCFSIYENSRYL